MSPIQTESNIAHAEVSASSKPSTASPPAPFEYSGVLHVHSVFSDGTGKLNDICGAAQESGLDFVIITDHMTLEARDTGWEGYHRNVLVLVGYEHHDPNHKNHYLIFGEHPKLLRPNSSPKEYIEGARNNDCIGFIAHPAERRKAIPSLPPYPWEAWDIEGFDGIEIWNQLSDWVEQITPYNLIFRLLFPRRFLNPPPGELIQRIDGLLRKRKLSLIGGVDAHAHRYRLGPFRYTLIPYKVSFKSIRTHVLLKDPLSRNLARDRKALIKALGAGSAFVSNYRLEDAKGFNFYLSRGNEAYGMGEEAKLLNGISASIVSPQSGEIRVLHNGSVRYSCVGKEMQCFLNERGVYRTEVLRNGKNWIYSNPIYLS